MSDNRHTGGPEGRKPGRPAAGGEKSRGGFAGSRGKAPHGAPHAGGFKGRDGKPAFAGKGRPAFAKDGARPFRSHAEKPTAEGGANPESRPSFEKRTFHTEGRPAFGERKPGFGERKSGFGEGKPAFGDRKPTFREGGKPSFGRSGAGKPAFGREPRKPAMNLAPRRVALETLLEVSRSDAYAQLALGKRLSAAAFGPRDRAFVTQLVYGTLENRLTLDWRIAPYFKPSEELDENALTAVREILRMGAYQLFYLDRVPDMAAVDESVSLTRAMGFEGLTGLVNAVLRNMIRGKDDVVWPKPDEDPLHYLSVMYSVPVELASLLVDAYGEHGALEILRYRPQDKDVTIRVNTLRCDDARLRSLLADDELEFDPGMLPGVYRVHHAGDLTHMRAYQNGLFSIQGESSVLAAMMIGAKPGQTILDACAAPGGKTAVLSECMNDTGRVYAWDVHPHRVDLIRGMVNRLKLENVRPAIKDAAAPRPDMNMTLDAALIDAPCSGTGVMLEKPDLKYRVTQSGVDSLQRVQAEILDSIAPMIKVGGTLVYSTCSVLPQENADQVAAFLERHPEYEVWPMKDKLPEKIAGYETEHGLQLQAFRDGTDGFFICRMRRVKA